jgi:hypothetical protein
MSVWNGSAGRRRSVFFVARRVSGSVENDSSCNSQVTICWIVIFVTDIGIHEAVSDSSVAVIG